MSQDLRPVYSAASGPCYVCRKPGSACSLCRIDFYCGKEHQLEDFGRHKKGCGVLELRHSKELGRHTVAIKKIPRGTVIIRELPLISYPIAVLAPGEMICAVCCTELSGGSSKWNQCVSCGWPVCDARCAAKAEHQDECQAFKRANFKVSKAELAQMDGDWLTALATLRICLASDKIPQLRQLQGNVDVPPADSVDPMQVMLRVSCFRMQRAFVNTVSWLRRKVGLAWIPDEKLIRAVAMIQINGFGEDTRGSSMRGVARTSMYAGRSMIEHSCFPNTTELFENSETGLYLAVVSRDVKKGEHLSLDYHDSPFRARKRRMTACIVRGFICHCTLCEDPTELGLYLSNMCCLKCAGGKKKNFINDDYKCTGCGHFQPEKVLIKAKEELDNLHKQSADLRCWVFPEKLLWPEGPLHPTHHMVLVAKMRFLRALARKKPGIGRNKDVSDEVLANWERVCRDVLGTLDVLRPGSNSHRECALMALYHVMELKLRNASRQRLSDKQAHIEKEMVPIIEELQVIMILGAVGDDLMKHKEAFKEMLRKPYR